MTAVITFNNFHIDKPFLLVAGFRQLCLPTMRRMPYFWTDIISARMKSMDGQIID